MSERLDQHRRNLKVLEAVQDLHLDWEAGIAGLSGPGWQRDLRHRVRALAVLVDDLPDYTPNREVLTSTLAAIAAQLDRGKDGSDPDDVITAQGDA